MPVTATITKEQRDGLYELVRHHLYSIDDLWTAFGCPGIDLDKYVFK